MNILKISILWFFLLINNHAFALQEAAYIPEKPQAPDFSLKDPDGNDHKFSDYRGSPVIVNFWATWCHPCRKELPSMNRGWEKIKNEGIKMIAINVGDDSETINKFLKKYPIDFTVLLDKDSKTLGAWKAPGLPTTYILDTQGRMILRAVGEFEWDSDQLLNIARSLRK